MKNGKRIEKVTIKRILDESPDLSYLGEYRNSPASGDLGEFAIDRMHSMDCAINTPPIKAIALLNDALAYLEDQQNNLFEPSADNGRVYVEYEHAVQDSNDAIDQINELIEAVEECSECGECRSSWNNREYRYFQPASVETFDNTASWIPKTFETVKHRREYWHESMKLNARKDFERMESYNNQNWYSMGIKAIAKVWIPANVVSVGWIGQTLHSGGLWGIESDSDAAFIEEVEAEQLSELKQQLKELGFGSRAISKAFKSIERKDS